MFISSADVDRSTVCDCVRCIHSHAIVITVIIILRQVTYKAP